MKHILIRNGRGCIPLAKLAANIVSSDGFSMIKIAILTCDTDRDIGVTIDSPSKQITDNAASEFEKCFCNLVTGV